ncbi:WD40-repeat-containing domain protein [Schizophyllum amplum]|uniref:WD40-repeat-containing domain protein n=1 Tax=Schizophyllum amplum TaxID=97359 RepID=A0A550CDD4_9AGAR|nr:WD40-repeat-containing domain protein [Auriculariopsis ampla]
MSVKRSNADADSISRKKPRTGSKKGKRSTNSAPLKIEERLKRIQDDSWKDDEAKELEGLVFGRSFAEDGEVTLGDNDDPVQLNFDFGEGEGEFGHLEDDDLFVVDGAEPESRPPQEDDDQEFAPDADGEDDDRENDEGATATAPPPPPKPKSRAAWHDPSDAAPSSSLAPAAPAARLRKLRRAPDENIADLSGKEYESRLRAQFKRIHGDASWVSKARAHARGAGADGEDEGVDTLAGVVIRPKTKRGDGKLQVRRLHDVMSGEGQGEIKSVLFHPSERVSVLAVGSSDRRVRLFGVSSTAPPTLVQTLHIPSLPLSSPESLAFSPSGREMLMSSDRRGFAWLWDLEGGRVTRRELSAPASVLDDGFNTRKRKREGSGVSFPSFSPTGSLLSLATEGVVCLYDWRSSGSQGALVSSFKPGTAKGDGGIAGVRWVGANTLSVLLSSSTVLLYDTRNTARSSLSSTPCVGKWTDEGGGFRGSARCLGTSASYGEGAGWLSIGSSSGLINLYSPTSLAQATSAEASVHPKPVKTIENLTTPISLLKFNTDASMLALASKDVSGKNAVGMRLFNTQSLTTYANFPTSATPLGRVTTVDFSRRGNGEEYLAVGNVRGRVGLWAVEQ